ncbi:MAG: M48 family metallopeptidase [Candidatus Magasanikbacteria bacterium]
MLYQEIDSNKRKSIFLLMLAAGLVVGLGYVFDRGYGGDGYGGLFLGVIISLFITSISYFQGDKIALWTSGAKPLEHDDNKYVYHLVENLCITAGVPMPKIYIMEESAINAFATGRNPATASIAITRGAIEKLQNEELEGVLAHELSHIKNYDIRFMMLVAVLVGSVSIMANIFLRGGMFRRRGSDREGGDAFAIFAIIGIVLAILSPIIAELIKLAVSRRREYLADASGALLTRYPEGLARALEKIGAENIPMARTSQATAHLFISSPFSGKKLSGIFSTHPPIEDRIKKLRGMA